MFFGFLLFQKYSKSHIFTPLSLIYYINIDFLTSNQI